jgi:hypothetical protein
LKILAKQKSDSADERLQEDRFQRGGIAMQGLSLSSFGPISPMIPPVAVPKFIALPAVNPTGSSAASGSSSSSTVSASQQYLGSVEESGGEYTASVANLSRATAIGSSVQAAENNLDTRIDELV